MLVLTRKLDESIVIGEDVVIQILETRGGQIRLGITAPREISVHRQEVYERIHGKLPDVLQANQQEQEENDEIGNT